MNNFMGAIIALISVVSASVSVLPPQPDPLTVELQTFLDSKGSPMPAATLVKYDNWPMVLAVSCAESGYGKNLGGTYNAWGIKDYRAGSPKYGRTRDFTSWEESIAYTSDLLYKYDPENGSPKPGAMVASWKYVRPFAHWLGNVNYALKDINENVVAVVAQS